MKPSNDLIVDYTPAIRGLMSLDSAIAVAVADAQKAREDVQLPPFLVDDIANVVESQGEINDGCVPASIPEIRTLDPGNWVLSLVRKLRRPNNLEQSGEIMKVRVARLKQAIDKTVSCDMSPPWIDLLPITLKKRPELEPEPRTIGNPDWGKWLAWKNEKKRTDEEYEAYVHTETARQIAEYVDPDNMRNVLERTQQYGDQCVTSIASVSKALGIIDLLLSTSEANLVEVVIGDGDSQINLFQYLVNMRAQLEEKMKSVAYRPKVAIEKAISLINGSYSEAMQSIVSEVVYTPHTSTEQGFGTLEVIKAVGRDPGVRAQIADKEMGRINSCNNGRYGKAEELAQSYSRVTQDRRGSISGMINEVVRVLSSTQYYLNYAHVPPEEVVAILDYFESNSDFNLFTGEVATYRQRFVNDQEALEELEGRVRNDALLLMAELKVELVPYFNGVYEYLTTEEDPLIFLRGISVLFADNKLRPYHQ